jgi:hypothetical protein
MKPDEDLAGCQRKRLRGFRRDATLPRGTRKQPKRQPLPATCPVREIRHEPNSTTCQCGCQMKRIGEDVAEKLDYVPGVFSVERHIRGKWACAKCETLCRHPVDKRTSSTRASPPPDCWPRCWWPSLPITCRCTARRRSLRVPVWRSRAPPWRNGWALRRATAAAGGCSEE